MNFVLGPAGIDWMVDGLIIRFLRAELWPAICCFYI
jgi:hypothetical protein